MTERPKNPSDIDVFSFQVGMINCFVEMVAVGVKQLAISPPLTPVDYEKIRPYSDQIVHGFGIQSYLETSLLQTDLQSPDFTRNKWSLLYYQTDNILDAYQALKQKQARLKKTDRYDATACREISIAFMQLLSYPMPVIESKLSGNHPDPFILVRT